MRTTPRGERFPKWVRLRRRSEFQRVYQGGRKCVRRFLVVYTSKRPADNSGAYATRLGITASRKLGGAVVRNRFRRHVRELFRHWHGELAPGHDIVVNARAAARDASHRALERDFRTCLIDLGLMAGESPPPPSSPSRG